MASRQSRIPESELPELHQKAVDLLDILQQNLPDKTGESPSGIREDSQYYTHGAGDCVKGQYGQHLSSSP
jgi:hypothetical protein